MFSLVQLECFIAVAEELHFGAAATRLQMTQPPLSRQIQQLERELDVKLFERTSRKVVLTSAGRTLLSNARRLIDLSAKIVADVSAVGRGVAGNLTVAHTAMAGQRVLPELIRRMTQEFPSVSFSLRELVSTDQLEEISKGTVDIGLLRPLFNRQNIARRQIIEEQLVLAVPEHSRLANIHGPIFFQDLDHEPMLMYAPSEARYFHDLLLAIFVQSGVQPRIVQYASQVQTLLSLVSSGLGFALVPATSQRITPPGVLILEMDHNDKAESLNRVRLDIAWNTDNQNPLLPVVLKVADEIAAQLEPTPAEEAQTDRIDEEPDLGSNISQ